MHAPITQVRCGCDNGLLAKKRRNEGAGWMGAASTSGTTRGFGISNKQKLYDFLSARPAGADARELVGLLLSGAGSDPELGARLVRLLLDGDPNFTFDCDTAQWRLANHNRLRVSLDQAQFTVVDLETTGGRVGPGNIIEIGAYRMVGRRLTESFST